MDPYRENAMDLSEVGARLDRLDAAVKKARDITDEAAIFRSIVRCLAIFAIVGLGTGYACKREERLAEVEVAKQAASKCIDAPRPR